MISACDTSGPRSYTLRCDILTPRLVFGKNASDIIGAARAGFPPYGHAQAAFTGRSANIGRFPVALRHAVRPRDWLTH